MAVVYLSPVGGVAAQFFNNDGTVLSGGKLYTYAAGTSTPLTSYTTNSGTIARSNPIILDSAGRVPGSGEIWITSASYKFVLNDSSDALIGTYDNIFGIGATSVTNYTGNGSTTVYSVTRNVVAVYINGVYQNRNTYTITSGALTFSQAPPFTSLIEILNT
jgi:hypothetical protein